MMRTRKTTGEVVCLVTIMVVVILSYLPRAAFAGFDFEQERTTASGLTPLQLEIEKQRMRFSSTDVEERRDALTRLRSMHNPEASRVALTGLGDAVAIVKVSATAAILSLPPGESARALIPLLSDKDEFVRRETSYALGNTRSRTAVAPLVELLLDDKIDGVRGAAAVALGRIGDETAVAPLASVLDPQSGLGPAGKSKKSKKPGDPFLLRAVARSLGQIESRVGLPALIRALQDVQSEADVRRESAVALGMVGDSTALPALREVLTALDPYLSQAAGEAIRRIQGSNPQ